MQRKQARGNLIPQSVLYCIHPPLRILELEESFKCVSEVDYFHLLIVSTLLTPPSTIIPLFGIIRNWLRLDYGSNEFLALVGAYKLSTKKGIQGESL
jgi:hypothetical protein